MAKTKTKSRKPHTCGIRGLQVKFCKIIIVFLSLINILLFCVRYLKNILNLEILFLIFANCTPSKNKMNHLHGIRSLNNLS